MVLIYFQGDSEALASFSSSSQPSKKKRKIEPVKDEDNYIPYRPSDFNSEKGYDVHV